MKFCSFVEFQHNSLLDNISLYQNMGVKNSILCSRVPKSGVVGIIGVDGKHRNELQYWRMEKRWSERTFG